MTPGHQSNPSAEAATLLAFKFLHVQPQPVNTTTTPLAGQVTQTRLHDAAGNVTSMPFHDQAAGTVVQAAATYDNRNQMRETIR